MLDKHGRKIDYLRVSITDLCNMRCVYCMPKDGIIKKERREILSLEEILAAVKAAVECGIRKVRLTGGEPLVRRNFLWLVEKLAGLSGLEDLSITTNGLLFSRYAETLKRFGIRGVNISLDTLKQERFRKITGSEGLKDVLKSIDLALSLSFERVKINMVVMRGINDDEVGDFARLTLEKDLQVRFIEYMPVQGIGALDKKTFVPMEEIAGHINKEGNLIPVKADPHSTASIFRLPGSKGTIGFISAVSQPFCRNCNKLRLTADGKLKLCLAHAREIDLMPAIRSNDPAALKKIILSSLKEKPAMGHLNEGGTLHHPMVEVGG